MHGLLWSRSLRLNRFFRLPPRHLNSSRLFCNVSSPTQSHFIENEFDKERMDYLNAIAAHQPEVALRLGQLDQKRGDMNLRFDKVKSKLKLNPDMSLQELTTHSRAKSKTGKLPSSIS